MSLPNESEWSAPAAFEPSLGSQVVTPRRGYLHHGIYVGAGRVVHYSGLAYGLRRGPVEEISLARFTDGRPIRVRTGGAPSYFDRCEVVRRARSRVGENSYRLFSNNCEHFCEWCVYGEHRSYQVEALLRQPARALRALIRFVSKAYSIPARILLGPRSGPEHNGSMTHLIGRPAQS
jgi:Lecithin retinol acyltransferase